MMNVLAHIPKVAPPNPNGIPRIVVPGGIGDIYWILVKLQAFCGRHGIEDKPTLVILSDDGVWESSRLRSVPFLKMVPFVQIGAPSTTPMFSGPRKEKVLQEFYSRLSRENHQAIYPGFMGYEYLICYNGLINSGHWLERDDDLECDWYFPMEISEEQRSFQERCQDRFGDYAVFYFSMVGDFVTRNMAQFPLDKMAEGINRFVARTGLAPVFIGAWWDFKWPVPGWKDHLPVLISKIPGAVNLVGQTSLAQAFGVMRGAKVVAGYHCGLTNMAAVFGKKTVLLWATGRFPENTPLAVAPPDTRMTSYVPLMTGDLTVDRFVETMADLHNG